MTALQEWRDLLKKYKVGFDEEGGQSCDTKITISSNFDGVKGYAGFFTEILFDEDDESFKTIGVWE